MIWPFKDSIKLLISFKVRSSLVQLLQFHYDMKGNHLASLVPRAILGNCSTNQLCQREKERSEWCTDALQHI